MKSNLPLRLAALALATLLPLTLASATCAQDAYEERKSEGSSDVRPDVLDATSLRQELRVMQRLLEKTTQRFDRQTSPATEALFAHLSLPGGKANGGKETMFPARTGASPLYLPGVGPVFRLSFRLPMRVATAPATKESPKVDAWEAAKREIEQGEHQRLSYVLRYANKARRVEIDQSALDRAIASLLRTLGKHAARVESVADDEQMFIVAKLSSNLGALWHQAGKKQAARTLVIQASKRDLLRYGEGNLTMKDLRTRARVTRY